LRGIGWLYRPHLRRLVRETPRRTFIVPAFSRYLIKVNELRHARNNMINIVTLIAKYVVEIISEYHQIIFARRARD